MSDSPAERWLPIAGYEGLYEVSDLGRVRSVERVVCDRLPPRFRLRRRTFSAVIRSQSLSGPRRSYYSIMLSKGGRMRRFNVHRLVALAFVPNPEGKPEVNHINSDSKDNRAANLEWVTRLENIHHGMRAGRINPSGEGAHRAKLTATQVEEIRGLLAAGGLLQREIGARFGISQGAISNIASGRTWSSPALRIAA